MRQNAQGWCTGMTLGDETGGRWERSSGWGTHVHSWLIHVNVWQKPLQYCKVISFQLKKKKKNWEWAFPATRDKMVMKCPPKYGWIYDHKGAVSTTNGHLPRALPMTEQQRHLPSAMVIEHNAAIAVDLHQPVREFKVERCTLCSRESSETGL